MLYGAQILLRERPLDSSLYANAGFPGRLSGRWEIMVTRQFARGAQRSIRGAILLALVAAPSLIEAQSSGNGFLFGRPRGTFTLRAGYLAQNTSSEPFIIERSLTTADRRSFDGFNLGFDLNMVASQRIDVVVTTDMSSRSNTVEYTGGWNENGAPITHENMLSRFGIGAGVRLNLVDRGRQISSLAYIPAKTLPYIGATAGVLWHQFSQTGDFLDIIDDTTANIVTDELRTDNSNVMGQVFAGIERRLNARWSVLGETRYTRSAARLVKDYRSIQEDINLSGLAFNIGATVRF
jgi:hypothetical protein